jgi:non-ribosomal peptide synthetase component E (peptide arylation enzyme)
VAGGGSGGENISSIEVENILHTHPAVSEAAVGTAAAHTMKTEHTTPLLPAYDRHHPLTRFKL